jgi:hypothetical protein
MDTRDPDAPHTPISQTDVQQGQKLGVVRWVLVLSLILVVVAFIAAFYIA